MGCWFSKIKKKKKVEMKEAQKKLQEAAGTSMALYIMEGIIKDDISEEEDIDLTDLNTAAGLEETKELSALPPQLLMQREHGEVVKETKV
eukprot:snap_masked-scaffold_61-processed-gene-0.22-mRNA-1 protein AED:1.00 eAED:1.00 QI:0/-1/0/0/-1/1/1/0/89